MKPQKKIISLSPLGHDPYQRLMAESLSRIGIRMRFPLRGMDLLPFSPIISTFWAWRPDAVLIQYLFCHFIRMSATETIASIRLRIFLMSLLIVKKILKIPLVWQIHDRYNFADKYIAIDLRASRSIARICDVMVAHSGAAKTGAMELFGIADESKIKVIPTGSQIGAYPNHISISEARERIGIDDDSFVFLFFGQIRPFKGVPDLIDAFIQLNHPLTKLVIAGEPMTDTLRREIYEKCKGTENIKLVLEFIPAEDVQIYMNASDIIVLPYKDILTSGVTALIMLFHKAAIASAVGGIPETLADSQKELLYDPSEDGALIKKMELAMKIDLNEIGEDNFKKATGEMNWDNVAMRLLAEVYAPLWKTGYGASRSS